MVQRGFDHDAEPANACWFLNALLARSDLGLYIIDHSVQESEVTCAGCMGDFQENPVRAVMSLPVPRTKSVPTLSTRAGSSRQFCEAFPVVGGDRVGQEQARKPTAALPRHLAAMADFSLATGLRHSNVTRLEWSQGDLGCRLAWIHADQAKGKRDRVPLSDAAIAEYSGSSGSTRAGCSRTAAAPSSSRRRRSGSAPAKRRSSVNSIGTICVTHGRAGMCSLAEPQDVEIDQAQNRTHEVWIADDEEDEILLQMNGVADGTRTHDNRNHNPGLYQLSYSHHGYRRLPRRVDVWRARQDSNLLPPA